MHWNIGDLYKYLYSLEFPIYLNNTVDLYGDGNDRPTGDYSVSDTTSLNYTDVTGDDVEKEFEPAELPWKNPTDASSTSEDNEPEEPKPEKPEEKIATNVSTGDNTFTYVGIGVFIASVLALYKKKLIKAKKYNNTIIY
jgi:heme-binding NEAT domain protein